MQGTDFKWFLDNYDAIFKEYGHSFVVIKDQKILGSYPTYAAGVHAASETESLGSFIVQESNGNESGYTNYIYSTHFTGS